jgi:hypothetical protein
LDDGHGEGREDAADKPERVRAPGVDRGSKQRRQDEPGGPREPKRALVPALEARGRQLGGSRLRDGDQRTSPRLQTRIVAARAASEPATAVNENPMPTRSAPAVSAVAVASLRASRVTGSTSTVTMIPWIAINDPN